MSRHWELLVAADFLHRWDAWWGTRRQFHRLWKYGLVADCSASWRCSSRWMSQIGRNHSDPVDGLFVGKRYLIDDRDPLFKAEFLEMLVDIGIQIM